MENKITEYIASVVPSNISDKRRNLLSDELESHIYDKVDHYEEIGYTKEQSIRKALEEMGEGEEVKKSINNSFEELYHEKTWWAYAVVIGTFFVNLLFCGCSNWIVGIVGYIGDPGFLQMLASLVMICSVTGTMIYAIKKRYTKMLLGICFSNLLIGISLIGCFYPQSAIWTDCYNLFYILDKLNIVYGKDCFDNCHIVCFWASIAFEIVISVCSIIFARTIEEMKSKKKDIAVKLMSFALAVFSIATCVMFPLSTSYAENYQVWFNKYNTYISADSEAIYESLKKVESYEECVSILKSEGYTNREEYEKTLDDKHTLHQFKGNMRNFRPFDESYEVWFNLNKDIEGNGFVFIKKDNNGKVVGLGIGNGCEMYGDNGFGYDIMTYGITVDMKKCMDKFKSLKLGDSEKDVMSFYGHEVGEIYTKFTERTDGKIKNYYRVFCYNEEEYSYNSDYSSYYIELTFEDNLLTECTLYKDNCPSMPETISVGSTTP